jgi:uncharacterized protein (TIGR00159 family)
MKIVALIANLRIQDGVDILFLSVVAYYLYLWFRGTKAFKALVGLLVLGVVFTTARTWGLFLTTWVFQILWQVLVILLIILFQSEIRQVLERVNPLKAIGLRRLADPGKWIPGFTEAIFSLAKRKIGALIIIERTDRVEEWVTGGHPLNAEPDLELLMSIFLKESPLHDGAMVIRGGQVVLVACYLPLSSAEGLPKKWGTRHRAALGLTEHCDASVAAVSEERGEVSLAKGGKLVPVDNLEKLSQGLLEAITPLSPPKATRWKKVRSLLFHQWPIKLGSLGLVSLLWLLLAGQQDFEVTFLVPLEVTNNPMQTEIMEPMKKEVRITARGLRKDASTLSERNVRVEVDVSLARFGRKTFSITRDQILLPNDRIQVVRIEPSQVEFQFKGKQ